MPPPDEGVNKSQGCRCEEGYLESRVKARADLPALEGGDGLGDQVLLGRGGLGKGLDKLSAGVGVRRMGSHCNENVDFQGNSYTRLTYPGELPGSRASSRSGGSESSRAVSSDQIEN